VTLFSVSFEVRAPFEALFAAAADIGAAVRMALHVSGEFRRALERLGAFGAHKVSALGVQEGVVILQSRHVEKSCSA
jgi:hypothetical protein